MGTGYTWVTHLVSTHHQGTTHSVILLLIQYCYPIFRMIMMYTLLTCEYNTKYYYTTVQISLHTLLELSLYLTKMAMQTHLVCHLSMTNNPYQQTYQYPSVSTCQASSVRKVSVLVNLFVTPTLFNGVALQFLGNFSKILFLHGSSGPDGGGGGRGGARGPDGKGGRGARQSRGEMGWGAGFGDPNGTNDQIGAKPDGIADGEDQMGVGARQR